MLDSIYIGMSGLQGYSRGLKIIANNTANINTPGFKSSSLQFGDMFYANGDQSGTSKGTFGSSGHGLMTSGTTLNFKQGELRQTGNALDLAVDGAGMFTLKDANGKLHYTRAGQFEFNSSGVLVNRLDGSKVMGRDTSGALAEITVNGTRASNSKASTTVTFKGNVDYSSTTVTVNSVKVIDSAGGEHNLTTKLTKTSTDNWSVDVSENGVSVGTGNIVFLNGKTVLASSKVVINFAPAGMTSTALTLDFSTDVSSFAANTPNPTNPTNPTNSNLTPLAFNTQDGFSAGSLTGASFDANGVLVMTYSNGQTSKGNRLALGRFDTTDAVQAVGGNQFDSTDPTAWHSGSAGENGFGSVKSGMVEISNVDLSQEFSDLVIMQRGYQASSQIITTANEMLQELFAMKGK
ncbi:flagellar hook protein FlgE [Undibacterium umbellatum]|uniref:Flagellar hook protein FlgE n=1 Tax=Undibacterium umbellatum TaxID=2762300 RepID=A0ABR6ZHB3_9BURK|nr:flagellar hook-basal body complex protein [Undibacterium umbellatum]MBC3911119.1 flagellar hook-basal body complex protein [Undibacterium umbellatum]